MGAEQCQQRNKKGLCELKELFQKGGDFIFKVDVVLFRFMLS